MTNLAEVTDVLRSHPFLRGLESRLLGRLAEFAAPARFAEGAFLFREGEAAASTYLVRAGRVSLEIDVPSRGPALVDTIGAGEVIGWSWLMAPYRWHFDARAVKPVEAVVLDGVRLRAACEADHDLGYELGKRFLGLVTQRLERLRMQVLDVYKRP